MSMIDYELLLWFNSGIGIGFVILTTLLLFPGVEDKTSKSHQENTQKDRQERQTVDAAQSSSSYMDNDNDVVDQGQFAFTPYQKMNFVLYIILFMGAGIILDREYGGTLSIWLRYYFPKEAALLGYSPLIERVRP